MIHFASPREPEAFAAPSLWRQVCIRAFPADPLAYFGSTADGNAAVRVEADRVGAAAGVVGVDAGDDAAVVVSVGDTVFGTMAAVASDPHSASRKSFHF